MNLNETVEKIMTYGLTTVQEDTPFSQLKDLVKRRLLHHLLVENNKGNLLGIISTTDLGRISQFPVREDQLLAKHIMTSNPVKVTLGTPIKIVVDHFLDNRFRAIPVIDEKNTLVGIVTPYDIMTKLLADFEKKDLNS